jgi:cardiolipin synthase
LDAATGSASSGKNAIDFLVDKQILGPAVAAVNGARQTIHIEVFQYQPDEIGWAFAQLLAAKAGQGVRVRLLLDGCGTNPKDANVKKLIDFLRQKGVSVLVRPAPLLYTHIDHRKVMVIDGTIGFTGGMNIGQTYQEDWHDQQCLIKGPVLAKLQEAFLSQWKAVGGTTQPGENLFPASSEAPDGYETRVVTHMGGNRDQNIKLAYLGAFATAQHLIRIADPYFVDKDIIRALMAAARRGVSVQVVLPAMNNKKIVQGASRAFYPDMIKAGVEVWEYQGRMAHDKVAVIDSYWATFGSSNLDARSLLYNDELNIIATDTRFASGIEAVLFVPDLSQSKRITSYHPTVAEKAERAIAGELSTKDDAL